MGIRNMEGELCDLDTHEQTHPLELPDNRVCSVAYIYFFFKAELFKLILVLS